LEAVSEPATAQQDPQTIFWNGLRLHRAESWSPDCTCRWETSSYAMGERCWLEKSRSGQYSASFKDGVVAYNYQVHDALMEACSKALDSVLYDAERLEQRILTFSALDD
jgi:hypothetical protein